MKARQIFKHVFPVSLRGWGRVGLFRLLLVVLFAIVGTTTASAQANEAYAVIFTDGGYRIEFHYDGMRQAYNNPRAGEYSFLLNSGNENPAWLNDPDMLPKVMSVSKATFYPGFQNAPITSTHNWFRNMEFLTTFEMLDHLNTSQVTNMSDMFYGCKRLASLDLSSLNVSNVTDMSEMFYGCQKLETLNLSGWNTAKLTTMTDMFDGCDKLSSLDVSGWTNTRFTDMSGIFAYCYALTTLNLTNFRTPAATNMSNMFAGSSMLTSLNLSSFNTSKVTNMKGMFSDCSGLTSLNLSSFNTAKVTDMSSMFADCSALTTLTYGSNWNTSKVTDMSNMFKNCSAMTGINLSSYNTASLTNMNHMFYGCSKLTSLTYGSNWNTGNVTDMSYLFAGCSALTGVSLTAYNSANVTNMEHLFSGCSSLSSLSYGSSWNTSKVTNMSNVFANTAFSSITLTGWNLANVTDMSRMFLNCSRLTNIYSIDTRDTGSATDMSAMFQGCSALTSLDLHRWNTSNVTKMSYMFSGCSGLNSLNVDGWNTSKVTGMFDMFAECSNLTRLNVADWNTDNLSDLSSIFSGCTRLGTITGLSSWTTGHLTTMKRAFYNCSSLTTLDLTGWNTSDVGIMDEVFSGCSNLRTVTLSGWDTSETIGMEHMFGDCTRLTTIYVGSGWNVAKVSVFHEIFPNCPALVGGKGTSWSSQHVDKTYARIDASGSPGYLTEKGAESYAVYTPDNTTLTFYYDANRSAHGNGTVFSLNSGGNNPAWRGNISGVTNVVFDASFASARPTSTYSWFYGMGALTTITGLENLNTSGVTNMGYMFRDCPGLTELDLTTFNTSKVTLMTGMFQGCYDLKTIYVGPGWDNSMVTSSSAMFLNCLSLVGAANTTYSSSHTTVAYAHVDNLDAPGYFSDKSHVGVYVGFDASTGTLVFANDSHSAAYGNNVYVLNSGDSNPGWYVNRKAVIHVVFDASFNDERPTTAFSWFRGMSNLQDISGLEYLHTEEVTNMNSMFDGCSKLTALDVSGFNTAKVTDMSSMFNGCSQLATLDLSSFNTASVTDMENMFNGCAALTTIFAGTGWDADAVTVSDNMFAGCTNIVGGNGTTYDASHVDKEYACLSGGSTIPSYLTDNLPIEAYALLRGNTLTFYYDGLQTIRAKSGTAFTLNTGNSNPGWYANRSSIVHVVFDPGFANALPATTYYWFNGMNNLTDITGLEYLHTDNVTNMMGMFYGCSKLKSLDLGGWNTGNVTNMSNMFQNCSTLKTIYIGTEWSTGKVTSSTSMFAGCNNLVGGLGTAFNSSYINSSRARVDGGTSSPGYLSYLPYATITHVYPSSGAHQLYLTFYCDGQHAQRALTDPVYHLNTGTNDPEWLSRNGEFEHVTFDYSFRNARPTSTYHWFAGMTKLTAFSSYNLNTSEVTIITGMFDGCSNLKSFIADDWDTSKVTAMAILFRNCTSLTTIDLNSFNTSNVTNMQAVFDNCSALKVLSLNTFSTAKVTNMNYLFRNCSQLETISVGDGWSTTAVTNSASMFYGCTKLKGGAGTKYNSSYTGVSRAHVDGGIGNPGYLSYLAEETYAAYDADTYTFTFYHDRFRSTRTQTYSLTDFPEWNGLTTFKHVVFDPSFDVVRPTTTSMWFSNKSDLEDITGLEYLHTDDVTSMSRMFNNCSSLTSLDLSSLNTSSVTTMMGMFEGCSALTTLDLSGWNTSNVTDMSVMFRNCSNLTTIYVGDGWSTANLTSTNSSTGMFSGCTRIRGGWDTQFNSSYTDKTYARVDRGVSARGYLSHKSKGYAIFTEDDSTLSIYYDGNYHMYEDEGTMYEYSMSATTPPAWAERSADVVHVKLYVYNNAPLTSTHMWFAYMPNLVDIEGFDYFHSDNVTDMSYMFYNCSALTDLDLTKFKTTQATDMSYMFAGCSSLTNLNVSKLNTQNVTNMRSMFSGCSALASLDLSSFITPQVTNMSSMFQGCSNLTTIYVRSGWSTDGVVSATSANMFAGCPKLVGANGTTFDASHTDKEYARIDKPATGNQGYLTSLLEGYAIMADEYDSTLTFVCDDQRYLREELTFDLPTGWWEVVPDWQVYSDNITCVVFDPSFDNARPTSTSAWFKNLFSLMEISGLEYLHTDSVRYMDYMFQDCVGLTSLDLNHFNTGRVERMEGVFKGCSNLTKLEVGNWDTHNVEAMGQLFSGCSKMDGFNLSDWNTGKLYDAYALFQNCAGLIELDLSTWTADNVGSMDYMFAGCSNLTTIYAANNWYKSSMTDNSTFDGCTSLVGGQGTVYTGYSTANARYAHLDGGTGNPGFFTDPSLREAYACYVAADGTLTFYNDAKRTIRESAGATIYTNVLNTGGSNPGWYDKRASILHVVFTPSFAAVRPKSCYYWFREMTNLTEITGLQYLKTDLVTSMSSMFYNCSKLTKLDVSGFNTGNVVNMTSMFAGCSALTSLDLSAFNTANVTSMAYMFDNCSALTSLDVSSFNTSSVVSMSSMFYNCKLVPTLDLSGFNTAKVTNMNNLFYNCAALTSLDVSGFNTANVEGMANMFYNCKLVPTLDVSGFNTDKVTTMKMMFRDCDRVKTLDLSNFNTEKVLDMSLMFYNCDSLTSIVYDKSRFVTTAAKNTSSMFGWCKQLESIDVTGFNTSNVTDMHDMFTHCEALTSLDVSNFNTAKVTNMSAMFSSCKLLTAIDVSGFNTENVTNMAWMFSSSPNLTSLDLSGFNTSKVTTLREMFSSCTGLTTLDLSSFNTSLVTNMYGMFISNTHLTTIFVSNDWNTDAVTESNSSNYMFSNCTNLVGGNGTAWSSTNPLDKTYARVDGGSSAPGYLTLAPEREAYACYIAADSTLTFYYDSMRSLRTGSEGVTAYDLNTGGDTPDWNDNSNDIAHVKFTSQFANARPTTTHRWFSDMNNLTEIVGIENLNTGSVTRMSHMFSGCEKLSSLDVSHFTTDNVDNMNYMFQDCKALTALDLSSFNTSNVSLMTGMFSGCSAITALDVSGFDTQNVAAMSAMFRDCSSLTSLDLSTFNTDKLISTLDMFMGCSNLTALDITGWNTASVTNMSNMFRECSALTTLDVSHFNTASVTKMRSMFFACSALTSLDLSNWSTANVTDMSLMFRDCSNLTTIHCNDNWNQGDELVSVNMFEGCTSLVGGRGTAYNSSYTDATYAHADASNNPGYFTGTFLLGDVNGDGSITIADVTALVNIILGKDTEGHYNRAAADVNLDESITIADVTALVNIILGKN